MIRKHLNNLAQRNVKFVSFWIMIVIIAITSGIAGFLSIPITQDLFIKHKKISRIQVETQFVGGQVMQIGETCCRILISSQETQKKVEEFYRKYLVDSERVEHARETE